MAGPSRALDLLYLSAGLLLIPYFLYRRLIKRKQSAPWSAKLGYIPARPAGVPRVWIHAVSVGEANAAETLFKELKRRYPSLDVVVSTTTVTGQEVARKRYDAENVFYFPLDLTGSVRRAFDRIRPTVIVLMELEVWPNFTAEAAVRNIPVVVVNGRITERSARRYRKFWSLAGPGFLRVNRWLVQSAEYTQRLKELGVPSDKIQVSGNIKYDAVDTAPPSPEERAKIRAEFGLAPDAPVLIGGSTHPTEESALLNVYASLRRGALSNLRLILVPRHPERISAVVAEVMSAGFPVLRRSEMKKGALDPSSIRTDKGSGLTSTVIVVDTVGELKSLYKAADVAFVGGSLIPHGGQNVMEPCGLGVAVVHGPHMHNFKDAMELLRQCNGSEESTRENLEAKILTLFQDRNYASEMATRARAAFLNQQGATTRSVDFLAAFLPPKR